MKQYDAPHTAAPTINHCRQATTTPPAAADDNGATNECYYRLCQSSDSLPGRGSAVVSALFHLIH